MFVRKGGETREERREGRGEKGEGGKGKGRESEGRRK